MHWVIQENLYNEHNFQTLQNVLEQFEIPHTLVKVIPFTDHLPWEERVTPQVSPEGLVMVSGSVGLAKIAANRGWTPGSFYNENHDYRVWLNHYGSHLLNAEAVVGRFGDIKHHWDTFFIRPCADSKTFSGQVMDWIEFTSWRSKVIDLKETYTTLDADTMVMMSPLKKIYREARFFVVDGRVVTGSTYKIGSRIHYTSEIPPSMTEYAQRMVNIWQPARAFVLDVALTDDADDGWNKVIEINCINCSGFYEVDVQKFVMAIEAMEF